MDGGERRHSQYGTSYAAQSSGRPGPGQPMGPPSQDRYSQTLPSPSRTDISAPSTGRPYMPGYSYGYPESQFSAPQMHSNSPMHGVQLQYTPYMQDSSRSHQIQPQQTSQQYESYAQGSMLPPMGQSSMYENMPQYQQQRQNAAIEVMASQFGGMPSYLQSGESSAVNINSSGAYLPNQQEQSAYSSVPISRPQLQPPFTPATSAYGVLESSHGHEHRPESSMQSTMEDGRRTYERQLRIVFEDIIGGRLAIAADNLMQITNWLLRNVRNLGLHHDDETNHTNRLLLWREFNHAWEALGQGQKSVIEDAIRNRIQPQDMISAVYMTRMIDDLISLCDSIEKYGLVDYEMGVWEEEIVSIFTQCLDLLAGEESGREIG